MMRKVMGIVLALVVSFAAVAAAKEKGNIELKVVSSKTKVHNAYPGDVFSFTYILYGQVNGKNVMYTCDQKDDLCPLMENGKTYRAAMSGDVITISMDFPDGKSRSIKYRDAGTW